MISHLTISPNEQHSAFALRLSRFRENDPYVKQGDATTKSLASTEYPKLESGSRDDTIEVELPEYDLRRAACARDPLAVIEGYKIEIYYRLAILLGVRMCPQCHRRQLWKRSCSFILFHCFYYKQCNDMRSLRSSPRNLYFS